jgi:hypothetical protein
MTTALVPVSRQQKISLKDASLPEVTEALLGFIPEETGTSDFPKIPAPLEANADTRKAFSTLGRIFNGVIVTTRRRLNAAELADLGAELADIQRVSKLLKEREDQIKEYARTHQDVVAEESGLAFPADVVRNGKTVATATPRTSNGHYLLAAPQNPEVTEIPGTNGLKFSNQYSSGRSIEDLGYVTRAYEAGEIDEKTYLACTKVVRIPDAAKIRAHALKTGDTSLLAKVVKKGRASASMYLRGLKK